MSTAVAYLLGGANPVPLLPGMVFTFGRDPKNSVHLKDGLVSRRHAAMACDESGMVLIVDFRSSNKTYVNDRPIEPREKIELKHNDKIRMGGTEFYLVLKSREEGDDVSVEAGDVASRALNMESSVRDGTVVMEAPSKDEKDKSWRSTQHLDPVTDLPAEEPPALAGQLSVQSMPQILQFLHHSSLTGALEIKTPARDGILLVEKGSIFRAESGAQTGLEAIYALGLLRQGSFHFNASDSRPAGETNVTDPMMQILFECCRRYDEAGRQANGSTDP